MAGGKERLGRGNGERVVWGRGGNGVGKIGGGLKKGVRGSALGVLPAHF